MQQHAWLSWHKHFAAILRASILPFSYYIDPPSLAQGAAATDQRPQEQAAAGGMCCTGRTDNRLSRSHCRAYVGTGREGLR